MNKFKVTYSSNNSGGRWWLKDEDWHALEKAGWVVSWYKNNTKYCKPGEDGRWLGGLAGDAYKIVDARTELVAETIAVDEWSFLTKGNASSRGCNCCGTPHNFYVTTPDPEELKDLKPKTKTRLSSLHK